MTSQSQWNGFDELSELGNTFEIMRRELRSSFIKIQELAVTDELTRTPNRRAFMNDAQKALSWSRRYNRPLTIALMDIDHFKNVNDTYGHDAGDEVLCDIANLIKDTTRSTDIIARYGGEEFILCLPETDISEAVAVAEKIRKTVQDHKFSHGESLTACIGLTEISPEASLESMIQETDHAMYQAKHSGRNRVVGFRKNQDGR